MTLTTVATSSKRLTGPQKRGLLFIFETLEKSGFPPTLRELCGHMGYSAIGSAQALVAALRKKGYLQVPARQAARSLILTEKALEELTAQIGRRDNNRLVWVSCIGEVPAGDPLEAIEERVGVLAVAMDHFPRPLPAPKSLFAVKAVGDSMVDAGIMDGDWLVVKKQRGAQDRDIVVARFNGDVTVKRLRKDQNGWYLQPENTRYQPIRATADEPFEVIGRVVAVQRFLH